MAARVVPKKAGDPGPHQREIAALREQVASLTQQLEWFKRQVFGERSERRFVDPQIQPDLLAGETAANPLCVNLTPNHLVLS